MDGGRVIERAGTVNLESETIDLGGQYLTPGFIDAHCHILPMGLDLQKLHLGECRSREQVLDLVRNRHRERPDGWLHAVHYDQNRFSDAEHITRAELDLISAVRPILLRHVNGHASVANSGALMAAGVSRDVVDPLGGSFGRDASGELNGLLLEAAHEDVTRTSPKPKIDEMVEAILAAGTKMRGLGITCASDMMTGVFDLVDELNAYRIASERGCPVRTRLYLQWKPVFGPRAISAGELTDLSSALDPARCRIAGIKIFADGAIASATAAIYGSYTGAAPAGPMIGRRRTELDRSADGREVSGQLMYRPERLAEMVKIAHDAGHPVSIHSIGDYATDLVMDAFAATDEPSRHRIEHAMILSDRQIERMAGLGIHCALQPEFLSALGHAYIKQLGPERASKLKRARSVLDAGIPMSFNSDAPVVFGNPWTGIFTASNRPAGFDASENVTVSEAILAYTRGGAEANGDSSSMGNLEPGMFADFNVGALDPKQTPSVP